MYVRSKYAVVSTNDEFYAEKESHPKRKYDIRFRMDGVSMYTVPTNLEGMETEVHWQSTSSTQTGSFYGPTNISPFLSNSDDRHEANLKRHPSTSSNSNSHQRSRTELLKMMTKYPAAMNMSSKYELLKLAVKDFQIRASYTYYIDVTRQEVGGMYLKTVDEDLVCAFMLDLPAICVDIDSSQFFIMLHVIRDVLLAPPPKINNEINKSTVTKPVNETEKTQKLLGTPKTERKKRSTVNFLSRGRSRTVIGVKDGQQPPSDKKGSTPAFIDIKNKHVRQELKSLVERKLAQRNADVSNMPKPLEISDSLDVNVPNASEQEQNPKVYGGVRMSRSVEYCIGRGQWFLRGLDASSPLVEVGFMGLYGSHSFNEDRYVILIMIFVISFVVNIEICMTHCK